MNEILIASLISSIFLNIYFHMRWKDSESAKDFYKFWNDIHIKTLSDLLKGDKKND